MNTRGKRAITRTKEKVGTTMKMSAKIQEVKKTEKVEKAAERGSRMRHDILEPGG